MAIALNFDPNRPVGFESRKSYARRCRDGFWDAFIAGSLVLDIGYRGGIADALPIVPGAIGIELDHTNVDGHLQPWPERYDGLRLPLSDEWADTIHASHVLEHVERRDEHLQEWHRVLRVGGTMIVIVPHAYLYERRLSVPPSRWSPEHLCSFTPASLLKIVEDLLEPNTYHVSTLFTDDTGYDYSLPINVHPTGVLEIVMVLRKVAKPQWNVEP